MWLTFALAIIIAASWFTKMILQRRVFIQRTPLDIPIVLFLLSQLISTIFSWDSHISIWGYYSRFNGGLLSTISYVFLYYSFLSNLAVVSLVKRLLFVSLISGTVVALWGLPSHFGYDPTCLIFRGTLDVSCWTADFQPMVRIFSTLGQPDWLAAYLAILIPIAVAFAINKFKTTDDNKLKKNHESGIKNHAFNNNFILNSLFIILASLFYLDLLYTGARSGVLAAWSSLAFFFTFYIWFQRKQLLLSGEARSRSAGKYWYVLVVFVVFLSITFFVGQPFPQLNKFTLNGIKASLSKPITNNQSPITNKPHAGEFGGTDSSKIRLLVWQGAIDAWRSYPIFGTGVETFASAYYRFKPAAHNLTSEWNFLYNKAHNEFLNYLATTGLVGLGSYLGMIFVFIVLCSKYYVASIKGKIHNTYYILLNTGLVAGYVSILVTNFFGFSVVITNIYIFMIPAFVFILGGMINFKKQFVFPKTESVRQLTDITRVSLYQWTFIFFIILASCFLLLNLFRYWMADKAYSLGYNLDRAGEYQEAYPYLQKAVEMRGGEPVFKDELAINNAILAGALLSQEGAKTSTDSAELANKLAEGAVSLSNFITSKYPNNVVFWKSRVRVFYSLGQADSRYLTFALEAIKKASKLSPSDANISYNLGVLYGQNGDVKNGIETLEKTIKLKPDYRDAYYALSLFYHDQAVDEKGNVIDRDKLNKAIKHLQYILDNLGAEDKVAKETLEQWKKL